MSQRAAMPLAGLVVASLLSGCGGGATTDAAASMSSRLDTSAMTQLAASPPLVTVLDEGVGPKQVLALSDDLQRADQQQHTDVTVYYAFAQTILPADHVVETPHMPTKSEITQTDLSMSTTTGPLPVSDADRDRPHPTMRVNSQVTAATISQPKLAGDVAATRGFTMVTDIDPSGRPYSWYLGTPAAAPDTGRAALEHALLAAAALSVVFPTTPIGVSGSWTVTSPVAGDDTMRQTQTYTLTSIDPDGTMHLDVTVSRTPALGALSYNTASGTAELSVMSAKTISRGLITVSPHEALPRAGQISCTTRVVYGRTDNPTRVVQDTTYSVVYDPNGHND